MQKCESGGFTRDDRIVHFKYQQLFHGMGISEVEGTYMWVPGENLFYS